MPDSSADTPQEGAKEPGQEEMRKGRRTGIIATLGPATSTYNKIRALYEAGADFFRLNFSHGTHEDHRKNAETIRRLEKELDVDIGIIADLQGPKLRIGTFGSGAINLEKGMRIAFDLDETPGDETRVCFPHRDIMQALEEGAQILMDDGNVGMRIVETGSDYFVAEVEYGSELSDRKGVNVPDLSVPVPALTDKDYKDLAFALNLGVDWIAQSFVQSADDVRDAKNVIKGRAGLIAKIEKPAAVENFEDILAEADAIMLARGDLGVEIPLEQVPAVQKVVTYEGRLKDKPVIVATQMLDSMQTNPRPTRAEVSDVAQAVFDGAHAVMLSGETSIGRYPVQAVQTMDKICREMENGKIHSLAMRAGFKASAQGPLFQKHRDNVPPGNGGGPGGSFSP